MNTAEQVDHELAKLWPVRGNTRGYPAWEKRLAMSAMEGLWDDHRPSKLAEWIQGLPDGDEWGMLKNLIPHGKWVDGKPKCPCCNNTGVTQHATYVEEPLGPDIFIGYEKKPCHLCRK